MVGQRQKEKMTYALPENHLTMISYNSRVEPTDQKTVTKTDTNDIYDSSLYKICHCFSYNPRVVNYIRKVFTFVHLCQYIEACLLTLSGSFRQKKPLCSRRSRQPVQVVQPDVRRVHGGHRLAADRNKPPSAANFHFNRLALRIDLRCS